MAEIPELPSPVQDLRTAMERVRKTQEAAGLIINLARYDAETDPINKEFMSRFLGILPVNPAYSGNNNLDVNASYILVKDPLNVRPTTSFSAFIQYASYNNNKIASYIIGEKTIIPDSPGISEILTVGWKRSLDKDGNWKDPAPTLFTFKVATEEWKTLRDNSINSLARPYPKDVLKSSFNSSLNKFVVSRAEIGLSVVQANPCYMRDSWNSNKVRKVLERSSDIKKGEVRYSGLVVRSLLSSDFEDFNVMTHLEYIAAAYGVGDEFDLVKAEREAKMPLHPAQTILGLPSNYRQVMEQAGSYDLPVQPE